MTLLSSMYLCMPSAEAVSTWKELLDEETPPFFEEIKAALNAVDTADGETLENLLWEHTRLFIGPYKLQSPPWESVYTSPKRLLMQDAADTVSRAYAEAGLAIDDPAVMPDHIGLELNFLALVLEKAGKEDGSERRKYSRIAKQFQEQHLFPWVPQFAEDLEAAAENTLYKAVARTTARLMAQLNDQR